jgi:hypothetical protein
MYVGIVQINPTEILGLTNVMEVSACFEFKYNVREL